MKYTYLEEESGESYDFEISLDYADDTGATFVAVYDDNDEFHEVEGKGHKESDFQEALDDYFYGVNLVKNDPSLKYQVSGME